MGPQRSGDRLVALGTVTAGPLWLMVATDAAHVTFAAIWGGGILALAIALALVLRKRTQEASLVPDGSELAVRFSRLATYSVFGVAVTGVVMAFFILPSPGALVTLVGMDPAHQGRARSCARLLRLPQPLQRHSGNRVRAGAARQRIGRSWRRA